MFFGLVIQGSGKTRKMSKKRVLGLLGRSPEKCPKNVWKLSGAGAGKCPENAKKMSGNVKKKMFFMPEKCPGGHFPVIFFGMFWTLARASPRQLPDIFWTFFWGAAQKPQNTFF